MSAPFRLLAGCATGPRIEGRYTIDAPALVVRSSQRMKLVAVCSYRKEKELGGMGTFRFQGNAEVSGKLWRDVGDSLGGVLWFSADDCQMATAKLRIRAFEYVAGPGVDGDGPFLLDYEIIRIEKPKQCNFN